MSKEIASNFIGVQWDQKKKCYYGKAHGKRLRSKDPQKVLDFLVDFRVKMALNRAANIKSILEQDPSFKPIKGFEWAYMISEKGHVLCTSEYDWRIMEFKTTIRGPVVILLDGPCGKSHYRLILDLLDNTTQDTIDYLMKWSRDRVIPKKREKKVYDHELQASRCEGLKHVSWRKNKNKFVALRTILGNTISSESVISPQIALAKIKYEVDELWNANVGKGWVVCTRFPELMVNQLGQVRRVASLKILIGGTTKDGYRRMSAISTGSIGVGVHNLVAEAFMGERSHPDGRRYVVDHINGIRDDNRLVNLQIISHRLNVLRGNPTFIDGTYNIVISRGKFKLTMFQKYISTHDTLKAAQAARTEYEMSIGDYFLAM